MFYNFFLTLFGIALCFSCFAQGKKDSYKIFIDTTALSAVKCICSDTLKNYYKSDKGKIIRNYPRNNFMVDNDNYTLIDTTGLFVYVAKTHIGDGIIAYLILPTVNLGFFSEGSCGQIFPLSSPQLKKHFKQYKDFVHAVNGIDSDSKFFKPSSIDSNITLVNELYNKYVRNKSESN